MNERLLPGRIRSGWGVSILFLCLMALSGRCSHEAIRVNLIPHPAEMEVLSGYFQPGNTTVDDFTTVVVDNSRMDALGREGYELTVDRSSVRLTAATQTGIFYGKRTLEQLMTDKGIPCVRVSDRPRFAYRGMHMDVSRHFFPKSQVLKMLDEMARYKLNVFHFHLTDNGGWRIRIDKYPRLTAEGGENLEKAEKAILKEIEDMKNGEITDFEIEATKLAVVNSFKSSSDSVSGIENWYTGRIFNGDLETVEEVSAEVNAVTKEQIVNAANKLLLDTVYVLKNK